MSVFSKIKSTRGIKPHIKDFVIEEIKKGKAPIPIQKDVKIKFGKYISKNSVNWIRHEYIKITGEHVKSYHEFHKLRKFRDKN